jgi:soluble lytic murein transglycosylase
MRQRIDSWLANFGTYVFCAAIMVCSCVSVAFAQRVAETNDETAMAIPRLVAPGSDRIDFPRPLSPSDVALVKHILYLQANGAIADADRELTYVAADWMAGPVLAARYLDPNFRPSADELAAWLRRFGDQGDSAAIAARLRHIDPPAAAVRTDATEGTAAAKPRIAPAPGTIRGLFAHNRDVEAVATGRAMPKSPGGARPSDDLLAAGLAAWRQNDAPVAAMLFNTAYETAQTGPNRSAAAYWMARVSETAGAPTETSFWLRRAALAHDTFYGRIARRRLGLVHALDPEPTPERTLGVIDFQRLMAIPRARRAFALLQVDESQRAEDELRALALDAETEPALKNLLVVVAKSAGMPNFAEELRTEYTVRHVAAGSRVPPKLRPDGGFTVDPTLVYGIVQHESNFRPDVVSSLGALGLMQIMPNTARGIGALSADSIGRLAEPGTNLAVGQRYMRFLAQDRDIRGDLLRLLSAYGQGQGAMKRWVSAVNDGGDPLMFIEAVPSPVLRAFLFDALAASWRYAVALRMPAPSLDALAAGQYPTLTLNAAAASSGVSAEQAARSGYTAQPKL